MSDLRTQYLGLQLKNPLVPSSSPLTGDFDSARRLEDAGAAALVLPSLFEEALLHEEEHMTAFLHHQDILTGSERVRIEIRDKDSRIVTGVVNLRPSVDYDIDYLQGRLLLTQPLSSTADDNQLCATEA